MSMKHLVSAIAASLIVSNQASAELVSWPLRANSQRVDPKLAKVVVIIHGCLQSAEMMALGTGWNRIVDKENVVLFYPQVPRGSHPIDCWNWYDPENQSASSGRLKMIRDQIMQVKETLGITTNPTFLAGLSSGAAMVSGLLACFPTEFQGGAVHSGPSYGLVTNITEATKLLGAGPSSLDQKKLSPSCDSKKYKGKIIVLQGTADKIVHPSNADRVLSDFCNGCEQKTIENKNENGLSFSETLYKAGSFVRGKKIIVEGLGHAWSGSNLSSDIHPLLLSSSLLGKPPFEVPFFSRKGPNATGLISDFFLRDQGP